MMTAEEPTAAPEKLQTKTFSEAEEREQIKQAIRYLASRMGRHVQAEIEQAYPVLRD